MDICWYFWENKAQSAHTLLLFFTDSVMKFRNLLNTPKTDILHIFWQMVLGVRQIDFKWCAIWYTKSATNVRPIWHIQFWDFYEYMSFKMLVFVIFCEESRIWVGKKLIPTKQLSICFAVSFILELHIENTRSNHSEVFL